MQNVIDRLRRWNHARIAKRRARAAQDIKVPHLLGVLGIMKNESMNILEWIEHYRSQGCAQIYLIDNDSTDDTVSKIDHHIRDGLVRLIELPERHKQVQHYWTAFDHFDVRAHCQWLIIADIDEFWFCKDGECLSDAIKGYQSFNVVYVNWSIFGSNDFVEHPKSLRKYLTKRAPALADNRFTKFVFRTDALERTSDIGVHKIKGCCSATTISDNQKFQLNHYVTQSLEYFTNVKMTRGDAAKDLNDGVRTLEYFENYNRSCVVEDTLLADRL